MSNLIPEDDKIFKVRDQLMVALSVELQRANSWMILERAPHVDNLIDADIVKCQQSITMKRVKAIESL